MQHLSHIGLVKLLGQTLEVRQIQEVNRAEKPIILGIAGRETG
jgi:hypothetical protein